MIKCTYCNKKIDELPFHCKRCGEIFCSDHRLPESHDCSRGISVSKRMPTEDLIHILTNGDMEKRKKAALQLEKRFWTPQTNIENANFLFAVQKWDELVNLGSPALEPIRLGLIDKENSIQIICAKLLGDIGDSQSINLLIQKLDNPYSQIRTSASIALHKLGWIPEKKKDQIDLLIAQQRWNDLIKIGSEAVDPLIYTLSKTLTEFRKKYDDVPDNSSKFSEYLHQHDAIIEMISTLGKIQDVRAWNPLVDLINSHQYEWPNALIFEAIRKIEDGFYEINHKSNIYCSNCFHKFLKYPQTPELIRLILKKTHHCNLTDEKKIISLVNSRIFSVCRNCKSNKNYLENVKNVVLLLDDMDESYRFENGILNVNWFKIKRPIDMNKISIIDATNEDISELVMKVKNDDDAERKRKIKLLPVSVAKELGISQAKINLLKNTFGNVHVVEKDTINRLGE